MENNFSNFIIKLFLFNLYFIIRFLKKFYKRNFIFFKTLLIFIVVSSCSSSSIDSYSGIEGVEENTMSRIDDIPFPKKTKLNINDSLIMGEGSNWSGQLYLRIPEDKIKVFNFYIRNLGEYGWKEQTTIRGAISVLNYLGPNKRVAIITIEKKGIKSSEVIISVSPFTDDFDEAMGNEIKENFLDIDE